MQSEAMHPLDQLAEILPAVAGVVDGIEDGQLLAPTPCRRFRVEDLLEHMLVLGGTFGHLFRGEDPPADQATWTGRTSVPRTEFRATMERLLEGVQSPGAMERLITAPVGRMSGEQFARFVALDGLVHGWDLAVASGQPYEPPDDVVAAVHAFATSAITPGLRDGDTFAAEITPAQGATPVQRLAAFTGRSF
jgi:uncharacterized protein (TIGR03086 family)